MPSMPDERDVIIIGSGPAGFTAALYAARANLRPLMLKSLDAGGQLMLTTDVENYPGFPDAILGPELMEAMEKQASRFEAELLHQAADRVDFSSRPFGVWSGDHEWRAKTVMIATGETAKWLGGREYELPTNGLFVAIGHTPNTKLFEGQLELKDGYIVVQEPTTRTSVPGVFAAGDVVDTIYRQAVTAAGMGCKAAMDAERFLE